jgi:transcriptional regulator with XRE-family HTH domain
MSDSQPLNRLAELREAMGMSRAGLADLVGVGEHQVRRWEAGELLIPTRHLVALADHFDVTTDHLLGLDREPTEPVGKAA